MREHSTTAKVNDKGQLFIYGKNAMDDFCSHNPGKTAVIIIKVYDPKTTPALRGYYMNSVVPECRQGFYNMGMPMSLEETEFRLRSICPIAWEEIPNEQTGRYMRQVKELKDIDMPDMLRFLTWVKQFAAEHLSTFIHDPNTL